MSEHKVIAKGHFHGEMVEATVINPGDWFGKTWLLYVADCFDPPLYVVEADTIDDALDEFAESEVGKNNVGIRDFERGDYGFQVSPGDQIAGLKIEKKGWIDLNGVFTDEPEKGKYLTPPSISGQGVEYDSESLMIYGDEGMANGKGMPWPCTYYGEGLPKEGIKPTDYHTYEWQNED